MKKTISALLIILSLTACAATDSSPRIVEVPVAAAAGVEPPVIPRPELALSRITPSTLPGEALRLYRESIETLLYQVELLEKALDAYRTNESTER